MTFAIVAAVSLVLVVSASFLLVKIAPETESPVFAIYLHPFRAWFFGRWLIHPKKHGS